MSASKAEEIKEKARKLREQAAAASKREAAAAAGATPSTEAPTEEDKTRALAPVTSAPPETAVELGQARVTTQDVVRAMVVRLLTDVTFANKIKADLRDGVR
ncbi:hypothetical protein ACFQ1S_20970 [Kibdelosporangium lantanae]|uniref:Uncharacterized protein n=1 Tax=Kibdelosporangium lantanae TaxID=1497396 RepID=A0ABW3MF39_9PSEU